MKIVATGESPLPEGFRVCGFPGCNEPIVRRYKESWPDFTARIYHNKSCAGKARIAKRGGIPQKQSGNRPGLLTPQPKSSIIQLANVRLAPAGLETAEQRAKAVNARARNLYGLSREIGAQDITVQYACQKGRCYYCLSELGGRYDVDHFMPLKRGGGNVKENIVMACEPCNSSKGDRLPDEFIANRLEAFIRLSSWG